MKNILFAFALLFAVNFVTYAQHTSPRFKYESSTLDNPANFIYKFNAITDTNTATDTTFISPQFWQNYYIINSGDTLNHYKVIYCGDVKRKNINYTDNNCYKLDNLQLIYKESVTADTIKCVGSFGPSGAGYTITTGTTNGLTKFVNFIFDGTNWLLQ